MLEGLSASCWGMSWVETFPRFGASIAKASHVLYGEKLVCRTHGAL